MKLKKKANIGVIFPPKKFFNLSQSCPKIKATMEGVKELVTYFKQTHLNSVLCSTLKQDVSTRWNSEYTMLESYEKSSADVKNILLQTGQLEKIMFINSCS